MTLPSIEKDLQALCQFNRRLGSAANRRATDLAVARLRGLGFRVKNDSFDCLNWEDLGSRLKFGPHRLPVHTGLYSLACNVKAPFVVLRDVESLRRAELGGRIAVLAADLCREQLMPKNFVFYNPQSHREIIGLLEQKKPLAVLAATDHNPQLAGALDPFPVIEDGDFQIPLAYLKTTEALPLLQEEAGLLELSIGSRRHTATATACNVIAHRHQDAPLQILLCAHIDSKPNTPGALDNAAGVATLLALAGMLSDLPPERGVQIVFFNGEDDYSQAGEMHYLATEQENMRRLALAINVDGAGYRGVRDGYSLWFKSRGLRRYVPDFFAGDAALTTMPPWPQGDHMLFALQEIPAIAISSENIEAIEQDIAHTPRDTVDLVDAAKLRHLVSILHGFILGYSG